MSNDEGSQQQPQGSDDFISLDDFILADKVEEPAKEASTPAASSGEDPVDRLLAQEDPSFAAEMGKLRAEGAGANGGVEIDSLDLNRIIAEEKSLKRRLGRLLKTLVVKPFILLWELVNRGEPPAVGAKRLLLATLKFGKSAALGSVAFLLKTAKGALRVVKIFFEMRFIYKLMVFAVVGCAVAIFYVMKFAWEGKLAPEVRSSYLGSFASVADESFTYGADEPFDDFNDPIFHPEHVVLFDKFVVNLKPVEEGANPMGLFEFYIEASTDEGAVELKDREGEVRDSVSRALEQMTYEELVTANGKNKLKIIMRKNLNEVLTKGRVRRIFYRNVVLKP